MTIISIKDAACRIAPAYPIRSIDLFGSYANGEESAQSDVDLLVDFDKPEATLFDLIGLKQDMEDTLNVKVDVVSAPLKADSILTIEKKVRLYEA